MNRQDLRCIANQKFLILSKKNIDSLSCDYYLAHKICLDVIFGKTDDNLNFLEIGPIVHSH